MCVCVCFNTSLFLDTWPSEKNTNMSSSEATDEWQTEENDDVLVGGTSCLSKPESDGCGPPTPTGTGNAPRPSPQRVASSCHCPRVSPFGWRGDVHTHTHTLVNICERTFPFQQEQLLYKSVCVNKIIRLIRRSLDIYSVTHTHTLCVCRRMMEEDTGMQNGNKIL